MPRLLEGSADIRLALRRVGELLAAAGERHAEHWLNTGPALQWKQGLPRGLAGRVKWRRFAALRVGIVGRADLMRLKVYAAAYGHPGDRHVQDLLALRPTDAELRSAARWVKKQDAGSEFPNLVDQVVALVRSQRGSRGR